MRMGGSDNTGDGLASQPRRYRVPGQPLLNRHRVGGVSRSPDGLFAQQEGEPTRGRPAARGKGTTRASRAPEELRKMVRARRGWGIQRANPGAPVAQRLCLSTLRDPAPSWPPLGP